MKILLKVLGVLAVVIAIAAAGGFFYIKSAYPSVSPVSKDFKIENATDSTLLKRGEYLVHHVTGCVDCHTPRQMDVFAMPRIEGKDGQGGMEFTREYGFPGDFISKNITPDKKTGIGTWSDAQLMHTVTTGVRPDGEPLFPLMPYKNYGKADPNDMKAILAYIRTLAPVENQIAASDADFPVSLFMRLEPSDANMKPAPDRSNTVEYGKYLVTLASCEDCHTKRDDKGGYVEGMHLAGGNDFMLKGMGTVRSANITSHETGIGAWNKEGFIKMFKSYAGNKNWAVPWQRRGYQTLMPWPEYAGMTEEDLGAIYDYLKTIPAVENKVVKWTPETQATASK